MHQGEVVKILLTTSEQLGETIGNANLINLVTNPEC